MLEDDFIEELKALFPAKKGTIGIGDDCAVIPIDDKTALLITTDALAEGIHFLKEEISPFDLGFKTVAVSVSDIAAMGGQPEHAFLSLALSKEIDNLWLKELVCGIKSASDKWGIALLGGDTIGSKGGIFLNLTLVGKVPLSQIKYRHTAKIGDTICVTENLGDSLGGLKILQNKLKKQETLMRAHLHPEPSIQEGMWLGAQEHVHAMMDLSDGLDCDLKRMLKASKCGAVIDVERLPLSKELCTLAQENNWDPIELALAGGEEYHLLFTTENFDKIKREFFETFGKTLYEIGKVTKENLLYQKNGVSIKSNINSFTHF